MVRTSKLVIILAALGLFSVACSKDDAAPVPRLSEQNESCESSGDCVGSLLCVNRSCTAGDVTVNPETKQCSLIACTTPADCCTPAVSDTLCETYNQACLVATDPTTDTNCMNYNDFCCPAATLDTLYGCTNGVCQNKCTVDADCAGTGLPHCTGGTCVDCTVDTVATDCPANNTCTTDTHACVPLCENDGQCPAMQHCTDKHCVFVGCSNDRECIAYSLDPTTTCDTTTHRCRTKCTNDAECLNNGVVATGLNYSFQVCISGSCQNAGCQSDDECKDLLRTRISATVAAVCAAPVTTN